MDLSAQPQYQDCPIKLLNCQKAKRQVYKCHVYRGITGSSVRHYSQVLVEAGFWGQP